MCKERDSVDLRLRPSGIKGELQPSARKSGPWLDAHAGAELDGKVLNDSLDIHAHHARFDAPIAVTEADLNFAGESVLN